MSNTSQVVESVPPVQDSPETLALFATPEGSRWKPFYPGGRENPLHTWCICLECKQAILSRTQTVKNGKSKMCRECAVKKQAAKLATVGDDGFITEKGVTDKVNRSVTVVRAWCDDGVLPSDQFRKIPGNRSVRHFPTSLVDKLALWCATENDLKSKGTAEPLPDRHVWLLIEQTKKVEDFGFEEAHYTLAALAEKNKTSEYLLRKAIAKANEEIIAEVVKDGKEPSTVKLIGKKTYGQIELTQVTLFGVTTPIG